MIIFSNLRFQLSSSKRLKMTAQTNCNCVILQPFLAVAQANLPYIIWEFKLNIDFYLLFNFNMLWIVRPVALWGIRISLPLVFLIICINQKILRMIRDCIVNCMKSAATATTTNMTIVHLKGFCRIGYCLCHRKLVLNIR